MPISLDLRERVVRARRNGEGTIAEVAKRFDVSTSSVKRWCKLDRQVGSPAPRPHGGGMPRSVDDEQVLVIIEEEPDATIAETAEAYNAWMDASVSESAISRAFKRLGLTRKKRPSMPTSEKPSESSG
jgi:transposase